MVSMTPERTIKKRRAISLEVKRDVIEMSKRAGGSVGAIVDRFKLPRSTILTILKNQDAILRAIDEGGTAKRARCTSSRYAQLECALLKWIEEQQEEIGGSPLSGHLIQAKAKEMADEMQIEHFKASNGWLQKFNSRFRDRPHDEAEEEAENSAQLDALFPPKRPRPLPNANEFEDWQQQGLTANDVLRQLLSVD
ncbi:HTH CENPB-type domain-containing protein [Aphelenchoides fujianensis]|nr:HTH CENPB-type domain-containing protein [Aphelenchoides fujianensis]